MDPTLPEAIPNVAPPQQEEVSALPGSSPGNIESAPNTAPEQPRETAPAAAPVSNSTVPTSLAPVSVPASDPMSASNPPSDDNPVIADDVDVIEKEWVDKAKKIVNSTREDPYTQEKEVSKLQADYLMKRYNKQVKLSE